MGVSIDYRDFKLRYREFEGQCFQVVSPPFGHPNYLCFKGGIMFGSTLPYCPEIGDLGWTKVEGWNELLFKQNPILRSVEEHGPSISDGSILFATPSLSAYAKITLSTAPKKKGVMTPEEIVAELDKVVVGHDEAKKSLAVAAYYHYKRIDDPSISSCLKKSNCILVGPTGTGKTLLLKTLSDILEVPFGIADATEFTPQGYVGASVEEMISSLSSKGARPSSEAIIFIDEGDKIAHGKHGDGFKTYDIQKALLKMVEGKAVTERGVFGPGRTLHTDKILFVLGGAFSSITSSSSFTGKVSPEDLVKSGLMPEFVGRFPIITCLSPLTDAELKRILFEPKDSVISEFINLFKAFKVELSFEEGCFELLAEYSKEQKTGARALRGAVERVVSPYLFTLPTTKEKKVHILCSHIKERLGLLEKKVSIPEKSKLNIWDCISANGGS